MSACIINAADTKRNGKKDKIENESDTVQDKKKLFIIFEFMQHNTVYKNDTTL